MKAKHTPGRLHAVNDGLDGRLIGDDGREVADCAGAANPRGTHEQIANAARLALCWNCHDDLVKALQDIDADKWGKDCDPHKMWNALRQFARAVLAKAKGGRT